MNTIVTLSLIVVGLINLAPVAGMFSASRMASTYGVTLADPNLAILMQHRALLFGLLGGFVLVSVFQQHLRTAAMILAAISMIGFAILVVASPEHNGEIRRVWIADLVGIAFLAVAAAGTVASHATEG